MDEVNINLQKYIKTRVIAGNNLGMTVPILLALLAAIIYAIYEIITIFIKHKKLRRRNKDEVNKRYSTGKNQLLIKEYDDEVYKKRLQETEKEPIDDYNTITKTIQNSFKVYSDYNTRMNNFFKSRKEEVPDIIDITSLRPENDNY